MQQNFIARMPTSVAEKQIPYRWKHNCFLGGKIGVSKWKKQTLVPAIMVLLRGWAAHAVTLSDKGTNLFCLCWLLFSSWILCKSSLQWKTTSTSTKVEGRIYKNCQHQIFQNKNSIWFVDLKKEKGKNSKRRKIISLIFSFMLT